MESVGQKLRQARLRQSITLDQIHVITRIPIRVLEAIENDQPGRVNGAAFYRSFARQFAHAVGLDYSEIAPAVNAVVAASPEPQAAVSTHYAPRSVAIRSFRSGRAPSALTFASFVVVLAGCSVFYAAWQRSGQHWGIALSDVGSSVTRYFHASSNLPAISNPALQSEETHPVLPPPASTDAAPATNSAGNDFQIKLSALESTWLSITADGKQAFDGILRKAETKMLEGRQVARIRTGNAGGVKVVFNGRDLGTLGPRGKVRVAVFTKSGYEVLKPPAHLALTEFIVTGE